MKATPKRKLHLVMGDGRENDSCRIYYAGFSQKKALETCIAYIRRYNVGSDDAFKNRAEFDARLAEMGVKPFVANYLSGWIRSPNYYTRTIAV